jgi:endo-1,4-beta-D-glucanase Y
MHRCFGWVLGGTIAVAFTARDAAAQNKPFPFAAHDKNGFVPSTVSSSDARASYDHWKSKYLKSDCGGAYYRVEFDSPPGSTVSEGMGYGMVLTAYFGDKKEFDGLFAFAKKNYNSDGMMGWKTTCSGFDQRNGAAGDSSATDGDTDIGFALVAAVDQWGDAYRQPALDFLSTLEKVDYQSCPASGHNMAKAGNWGGGCDFSNSSYWMPGYYRVFHEFSGDAFWGKAADDAVGLYLKSRNASTGLLPNQVDENGVPGKDQSYVDYNGCRIPWRAVADYLWYGTADVKTVTDKLTDWANGIGIANIVDGYKTDGTPTGQYTQLNPWAGSWACGAMSKSQAVVDAFAADFKNVDIDEGGYYGSSLRTLYLLMLSGNFWRPGDATSTGGPIDGGPLPKAPVDAAAPMSAVDAAKPNTIADARPSDLGVSPASTDSGCSCELGREAGSGSSCPLLFLAAIGLRRARRRIERIDQPLDANRARARKRPGVVPNRCRKSR